MGGRDVQERTYTMSLSLSAAFYLRFLSFLGVRRDSRVYAVFIFQVNRSTINRRLTKGDGHRYATKEIGRGRFCRNMKIVARSNVTGITEECKVYNEDK